VSGWIKLEKDIESDPRVLRMAKAVAAMYPKIGNAPALHGVTLVLGALARLWIYADSHVRADDTLELGAADLDERLGIPGFCALMPEDWLRVIDDETVELPGFQEHNSVAAKRAAQTTKRVARHRVNVKRNSVTGGNAAALPTKTETRPRQDQDHTEETARASRTLTDCETTAERRRDAEAGRGARLPADFDLTAERRRVAEAEHVDPERTFAKFTNHWRSASGANARKRDWDATWRNWCLTEADRARNGTPGGNGTHKPVTKFEQMQARLGSNELDENGQPIPF
jgi:hypothetical protein